MKEEAYVNRKKNGCNFIDDKELRKLSAQNLWSY